MSYHFASQRIQELLGAFIKHENVVFNGEQEKESISRVRVGSKNLPLGITVCHHSGSLVIPNGDPRERFPYPTLSLMIDSYILLQYEHKQVLHLLRFIMYYSNK